MISGNIKNMEIGSFSLNVFLMKQEWLKGNPSGEFGSLLPFPVFQGEFATFCVCSSPQTEDSRGQCSLPCGTFYSHLLEK